MAAANRNRNREAKAKPRTRMCFLSTSLQGIACDGKHPVTAREPGDQACVLFRFVWSVLFLSSLSGEFGQQVLGDIWGHSGTSRAMSDLDEAKIANQRLDSWKEIATFFRRDERTVKRWEKERGLPVHRLQGSATGRVYAYSDELLRWMKSPVSAESVASTVEPAEADHDTSAVEVPQAATLTQAVSAQGEVNLRRRVSDQVRPARWGRLFGAFVLAALLVVTGGFLYLKRASLRASRPDASPGESLATGQSTNAEARDFYLKGRYEWDKRTPESLNKAVDYFTQ